MAAQTVAFLIILPFSLAFVYAAIHEYMRYRSEGTASYGLVYDEETGTTYTTGIAEGEEAYNPDEFDPGDYNDPDTRNGSDDERT